MPSAHPRRAAGALVAASLLAIALSGSADLACSGSNDCIDVDPSTYDRTCTTNDDCTLIDVGNLCSGGCLCAESAAVNVKELPRYQSATASLHPGSCQCGFPGTPSCVAGQCELCPTANGCATDAGTDAPSGG